MAKCARDESTGKVVRLKDETFFRYQVRQGWCAFLTDAMALEAQGTLLVISMGCWFLTVDVFNAFPRVYSVMNVIMAQWLWGLLFLIIGAAQAFTLLTNNLRLRKRMLLVKTALWVFLLCTALYGNWRAPGVPIYFILATTTTRGYFCLQK